MIVKLILNDDDITEINKLHNVNPRCGIEIRINTDLIDVNMRCV